MIDAFTIFDKGGRVYWCKESEIDEDPIDELIHAVLSEERAGVVEHTSGDYTMKWTFHNQLDLVFVVVYQKIFRLLYVDDLLKAVKKQFLSMYEDKLRVPKTKFTFDAEFQAICDALEKRSVAEAKKPKAQREFANDSPKIRTKKPIVDIGGSSSDGGSDEDEAEKEIRRKFEAMTAGHKRAKDSTPSKPKKWEGGGDSPKTKKPAKEGKKKRDWGDKLTKEEKEALDYSKGGDIDAQSKMEAYKGSEEVDLDASLFDDSDEEETGFNSRVKGFFSSLAGNKALTKKDLLPVADKFRDGLMAKNVATDIAEKICESIVTSLEGKKLSTLQGVHSAVKKAMEDSLTRILTPKRSIDILRDVKAARAEGRPYNIVFVGVNGVGKSTSLAKVCNWLLQNNLSVQIAACDNYRSGAVEQLRTHCRCLGVPLYDRGYKGDASSIAMGAIREAKEKKIDVTLVDTAGRMQDNEPLMRSLAKLVHENEPDLVLFVGEALVGNDGVDQLTKFNQCLVDLSPSDVPRVIDGIILTKFDTIDEKMGAAISMVYTTGQPIVFVGVGQTYADLRKLNIPTVVKCLLR